MLARRDCHRAKDDIGTLQQRGRAIDGGGPAPRPFVEQNRVASCCGPAVQDHMLGNWPLDNARAWSKGGVASSFSRTGESNPAQIHIGTIGIEDPIEDLFVGKPML